MRMMTAEEAFNVSMNMYPTLYSSNSIELSRLKYFDQIFNVIGNGYNSLKEFKDDHKIQQSNLNWIKGFPNKYISGEPLFCAYKEVENIGDMKIGKYGSEIPGLYSQTELNNMPHVAHTYQANSKNKDNNQFIPYPNFFKNYSMVWDNKISSLDKSWHEAALFFYKKSQEFFNSENSSNYHMACPQKETPKLEKLIKDYDQGFQRYKEEGMTTEDFHKKISKEYGLDYHGDTKDFIQRGWEKELGRIHIFLNETIERLENILSQENEKIISNNEVKKKSTFKK